MRTDSGPNALSTDADLVRVVEEAFPLTGERFALVVVRPGDPNCEAGPIVARNGARWLVVRAITYEPSAPGEEPRIASITQQECFFVRDQTLPIARERLRSYLAAIGQRIEDAPFEDLAERPPWIWFAGELLDDLDLVNFDDFLLAFPRVTLTLSSNSPARGVTLTRTAAQRLERVRRRRLTFTSLPEDRPTSDPQMLGGAQLHLDERSVVRVGTRVTPGSVLVGAVGPPDRPLAKSPEQRRAANVFGEREWVDRSFRAPPDVEGQVIDVHVAERDDAGRARIDIVIAVVRPIEVGDVLECAGEGRSVVSAIVESQPEGEVAWPGLTGRYDLQRVASARDTLHARCVGPYSPITQQPLAGKESFGGQLVTRRHVEALLDRGASWVVHELMTVKSDDIDGRVRLFASIVEGRPECVPTIPRTTRDFERQLLALGFDVSFDEAEVAIGLLSDEKIRRRMPGRIIVADTIDPESHEPIRGGLFCTEIFGNLRSPERVTTMGHIALPVPVMHPWAFDLVCTTLDLDAVHLHRVLGGEQTLAGGQPASWQETGPLAIRDALTARGSSGLFLSVWPVLPPDASPIVPLPDGRFATSDLNNLYVNVMETAERLRRLIELGIEGRLGRECGTLQKAVAALVENGSQGETLVTEHDGRALVSLADDLFGARGAERLLSKRVDYSAIAHVVGCDALDPEKVLIPRAVARELFRPWTYGALERAGHTATICESKALLELGDRRASEALEDIVRDYPAILFFDDSGRAGARVMALAIELWDTPAFGLAPALLDALGSPMAATLHVPIDPRAVSEARECLRVGAWTPAQPREQAGWLAQLAEAPCAGRVLIDAALRNEVDPMRDWRARLMLGRLPFEERTDDA